MSATDNSRQRDRMFRFWRSGAGVWVGLVLASLGGVLIAVAWFKTTQTANVGLQVPYLLSGGIAGLGLVLLGLFVVNLSVKRRDAMERSRQLDELRESIVRLRTEIEGEGKGKK